MIPKEKVKTILDRLNKTINEAYELDNELDIDSFLEALVEVADDLEEVLEDDA